VRQLNSTNAQATIWALTLALMLIAGWLDLRSRRIPNWLTVSGLLVGVGVHALAGWRGVLMSVEGAAVALAILLPLVLLRALGAGDWKLMGAAGSFLGPLMLIFVLLASIFIAGLMGIVRMMVDRRVMATLRNMRELVRGFISFGLRPHPIISLDNPELPKLPFGVAAAIGTMVCFAMARWGL
jgi:prepilin peptidase CpaA